MVVFSCYVIGAQMTVLTEPVIDEVYQLQNVVDGCEKFEEMMQFTECINNQFTFLSDSHNGILSAVTFLCHKHCRTLNAVTFSK